LVCSGTHRSVKVTIAEGPCDPTGRTLVEHMPWKGFVPSAASGIEQCLLPGSAGKIEK
jgi:hypothetical protein